MTAVVNVFLCALHSKCDCYQKANEKQVDCNKAMCVQAYTTICVLMCMCGLAEIVIWVFGHFKHLKQIV